MTIKYYDANQIYMTFERPFVEDHLIKSGHYNKRGAKLMRERHPEPIIQRQLLIDYNDDWCDEFLKYINTERYKGSYDALVHANGWRGINSYEYDFYIWTPELHAWVQEMNKLFGTKIKPRYLTYNQYQNIRGIDKYVTEDEADKLEAQYDRRMAA
jgi:hypothetical protein